MTGTVREIEEGEIPEDSDIVSRDVVRPFKDTSVKRGKVEGALKRRRRQQREETLALKRQWEKEDEEHKQETAGESLVPEASLPKAAETASEVTDAQRAQFRALAAAEATEKRVKFKDKIRPFKDTKPESGKVKGALKRRRQKEREAQRERFRNLAGYTDDAPQVQTAPTQPQGLDRIRANVQQERARRASAPPEVQLPRTYAGKKPGVLKPAVLGADSPRTLKKRERLLHEGSTEALRSRMQDLGFESTTVRPFTASRPVWGGKPEKVPPPPQRPVSTQPPKPKQRKLQAKRSSASFPQPARPTLQAARSSVSVPQPKPKPKKRPTLKAARSSASFPQPKPEKPEPKPEPKPKPKARSPRERVVYRERGAGRGSDMKVAPTQQVTVAPTQSSASGARNAALEKKIDELLRSQKEKKRKSESRKVFTAAKKQYRAYRKQQLAGIKKQNKEIKKRELAKIRRAPAKERVRLRKDLKEKLKVREDNIKKRLPAKIQTPGQLREIMSSKTLRV